MHDYDALLERGMEEARSHVRRAQRNLPNRASFYLQIVERLLDEAPLKMSLREQDRRAAELDELIGRLDAE